ncbi:MAG: hypothetical protein ABEJ68_00440 [Halobacteriaceae archaeon]
MDAADAAEEIWTDVSSQIGDDLRAVMRFTPTDHAAKMRPDVRETYTLEEKRNVADDTIVAQLGLSETERGIKAGELEAVVRVFGEAWVVSWADGQERKSGVNVSISRDGDATMADVAWCLDYLSEFGARLD